MSSRMNTFKFYEYDTKLSLSIGIINKVNRTLYAISAHNFLSRWGRIKSHNGCNIFMKIVLLLDQVSHFAFLQVQLLQLKRNPLKQQINSYKLSFSVCLSLLLHVPCFLIPFFFHIFSDSILPCVALSPTSERYGHECLFFILSGGSNMQYNLHKYVQRSDENDCND